MKKLLLFILFVILTMVGYSQTTYTVNSTDDLPDIDINDADCADANGNCTLRAAIQNANKTNNKDTIKFNIVGTAPYVINVLTEMLPAIMRPVIIDGRTQPGYANAPLVEINGSGSPLGNSGIRLLGVSDNSEIYGLCIGGFQRVAVSPFGGGFGIDVSSQRTIMQSNYIGLKPDGTTLNRNQWGVYFMSSNNNTFGGTGTNQGNVVSGNYSGGVTFSESSNNVVQGNLLGTDAKGLLAKGNRFNLQILNSSNNTIGGNTPQARNILSGGINSFDAQMDGTGISMTGVNSKNNVIIGNYFGTDITGTKSLPNARAGILLLFGSNNNSIGGEGAGEGNVISGNGAYGIYFQGNAASPVVSNSIKGNYVGVDVTGNLALPNDDGILFLGEGQNNNFIGGTTASSRNVISGNKRYGIGIIQGGNNQIIGNYIGTNASGTAAIPNVDTGVRITASNTIVGGQTAGSRNIISGNATGVVIGFNESSGSKVIGNYIGLNASGSGALPNVTGVSLFENSMSVVVGGANPLDRNIISGNSSTGLMVSGVSHDIQNNYIGLSPNGSTIIKNNDIGLRLYGILEGSKVSGNTISGNGSAPETGRNVLMTGANGVHFFSNKIGTLPDGITGAVNVGNGMLIQSSLNNLIGGFSEVEGNIMGNHDKDGVLIAFSSINNTFGYNKIGVGADGVTNLGNAGNGVTAFNTTGVNTGNTFTKNIIANNKKGLELDADTGVVARFTISENSIYNNSTIGIDLLRTSVNDVGDADAGVNNLQNSPEVSSIKYLGSDKIEIKYAVTSTVANSAYPLLIEFFGAVNGQGKFFMKSDSYTAPGVKTITIDLPSGYNPDDYSNIVATATDANGNTSEFGVNISYTLSISQFENQSVKLYPNPVSNRLFLQFPNSESYNLKLVNALGQVVLTKANSTSSIELDVSDLSKGMYFLNVTSEIRNSQTLKFIKN